MTAPRILQFSGIIHTNTGQFNRDMVIPGRGAFMAAPLDWPITLQPGTLNIKIDLSAVPGVFSEIGSSNGIKRFDERNFAPAFVIPQDSIKGNTLKPNERQPNKGTAQIWRAELLVISTGKAAKCWMLRRIGSGIYNQIELVSDLHLRSHPNLTDDIRVTLTVFEGSDTNLIA